MFSLGVVILKFLLMVGLGGFLVGWVVFLDWWVGGFVLDGGWFWGVV